MKTIEWKRLPLMPAPIRVALMINYGELWHNPADIGYGYAAIFDDSCHDPKTIHPGPKPYIALMNDQGALMEERNSVPARWIAGADRVPARWIAGADRGRLFAEEWWQVEPFRTKAYQFITERSMHQHVSDWKGSAGTFVRKMFQLAVAHNKHQTFTFDVNAADAAVLAAERMGKKASMNDVHTVDDITKKLGHFERPVGKYPKLDWTQGVTDRCRAAMNEENRDITEATNQLNELLIELDELKFEAWRCYTAPEFDAKLTAMRQLADRIRQRLALASTTPDGRGNS